MKDLVSMGAKSMKASDAGGMRHRGFTLIELLVAMVIASIVMAAMFSVYAGLTRSYTTQNAAAGVQQTMRAGINLMVDDIMMAGFDPKHNSGAGFLDATSTLMRFTSDRDWDGIIKPEVEYERITYQYVGGSLSYKKLDTETLEPFIENVTDLSFVYLDYDGNPLGDPVPAANLDDIRTVVITLTVQEKVGRGKAEFGRAKAVDQTYTTQVRCRNMGI